MIIDMHAHILTEQMIRLMQGVSKAYAPTESVPVRGPGGGFGPLS